MLPGERDLGESLLWFRIDFGVFLFNDRIYIYIILILKLDFILMGITNSVEIIFSCQQRACKNDQNLSQMDGNCKEKSKTSDHSGILF